MLSEQVQQWVLDLWATRKISQRKIAIKTGVSRGSVSTIVRRGHIIPRRKQGVDSPLFDGPRGRCPECGAMVYLPCRECSLGPSKRVIPDTDGDLQFDLRGGNLERHKRLRGWIERQTKLHGPFRGKWDAAPDWFPDWY